jgi:hypothetical protein
MRARLTRSAPCASLSLTKQTGAATSLKYAQAQDLPSFPSAGNVQGSAGKAAMLAKDYKMKDLWQPEQSQAGSQAAILAAGKGAMVQSWKASPTPEGQSAATLAFRNQGLSTQARGANAPNDKNEALRAATMSVNKGKESAALPRAPPAQLYPDQMNSAKNALNAATVSHRQSLKTPSSDAGWNSEANQAARVTHLGQNVSGKMFTSAPNWQYEEDKHQAALKASAISMAKTMYASQDRSAMLQDPDGSDLAGARSAARNQAVNHPDIKKEAMAYISLQDAAHRLAAERLAKVDKDMESQRYREYYGYDTKPKRLLSSRMSLRSHGEQGRSRARRRASSEGTRGRFDSDSDDEEQARQIRSQMAGLNAGLHTVDAKKQQDDRAKLLAAAEKRVSTRMQDMDAQVYRDTGKVSPAMMEEWEAKARQRAEKDREQRTQNPGKTHIGGGKFMDQTEIEAIAAARLKPTLDEINDTAEKKRERDEELRVERDRQQTERMEEKIKQQNDKAQQRALKGRSDRDKCVAEAQLTCFLAELRESSKREKAEGKARKDEEKSQRKSRDGKGEPVASDVVFGNTFVVREDEQAGSPTDTITSDGKEKHKSALARLKEKFRKSGLPGSEPRDHAGAVTSSAQSASLVDHATNQVSDDPPRSMANFAEQSEPVAITPVGNATSTALQHEALTAESSTEGSQPNSPIQAFGHAGPTTYAPTAAPVIDNGSDVESVTAPMAMDQADNAITSTDSPYEAEWKSGGAVPPGATIASAAVTHVDPGAGEPDDGLAHGQSRPAFQQTGSMSGYTDNASEVAGTSRMPGLERHISQIPESDTSDESSGDDDSSEEPALGNSRVVLGQEPTATDRLLDVPDVAKQSVQAEHRSKAIADLEGRTEGASGQAAPAEIREQQVSPTFDTNEPPYPANILHQETTSRLDDQRADAPGISGDPDASQLHGIPVDTSAPDTASMVAIAPLSTQGSPIAGQRPTPATANDQASLATSTVLSQAEVASTAPGPAPKHESGKGVRGFFNKLTGKSRSEREPGKFAAASGSKTVPYESAKAGDKPTMSPTRETHASAGGDFSQQDAVGTSPSTVVNPGGLPPVDVGSKLIASEHVGTDGPIGDGQHVSGLAGNPEPDSPSSFRRGDITLNDPDDASSSGADEDDIKRGRTGGFATRLGIGRRGNDEEKVRNGKLHKLNKRTTHEKTSSEAGPRSSNTDDEQFEEARDHFEDTLVPPPAIAGLKKSESPVRGTRFVEDV